MSRCTFRGSFSRGLRVKIKVIDSSRTEADFELYCTQIFGSLYIRQEGGWIFDGYQGRGLMKSVIVLLASGHSRNRTRPHFKDKIASNLSWLF
jgi:hypothetical protein